MYTLTIETTKSGRNFVSRRSFSFEDRAMLDKKLSEEIAYAISKGEGVKTSTLTLVVLRGKKSNTTIKIKGV